MRGPGALLSARKHRRVDLRLRAGARPSADHDGGRNRDGLAPGRETAWSGSCGEPSVEGSLDESPSRTLSYRVSGCAPQSGEWSSSPCVTCVRPVPSALTV